MLACWTEIEKKTQAAATFTVDILCAFLSRWSRCSDKSSCSFSNIAHVYRTTTETQISQTPGRTLPPLHFSPLYDLFIFLTLCLSPSSIHPLQAHTGEIGIFPTCKIELLYKLVQVNKIDATSITLDDCCCFCNQRISFSLLKGNKTYLCCRYFFLGLYVCWMSFQKRECEMS